MQPRELKWSEIETVVTDYFLKWLQFTHLYYLIPKEQFLEKSKPRVIISTYFKDYQDLLREIVFRIPPETRVEKNILKLLNLTKEEIGKKYVKGIT